MTDRSLFFGLPLPSVLSLLASLSALEILLRADFLIYDCFFFDGPQPLLLGAVASHPRMVFSVSSS